MQIEELAARVAAIEAKLAAVEAVKVVTDFSFTRESCVLKYEIETLGKLAEKKPEQA